MRTSAIDLLLHGVDADLPLAPVEEDLIDSRLNVVLETDQVFILLILRPPEEVFADLLGQGVEEVTFAPGPRGTSLPRTYTPSGDSGTVPCQRRRPRAW